VEFSSTCGFGFKNARFKTACSTGAWWIFLQPVEFALEYQAQKNSTFHRWHVNFSTTCGFFSKKSKDNVD